MRQSLLLAALVIVAASVETGAQGVAKEAPYPAARPIRLVVPFTPGGGIDVQARLLSAKLEPRLGQKIVIDNRGGAAGNIGMEIVARAPADGYTIIIATVGTWTVNPHIYKSSFDVVKDFSPVIQVAATPGLLVVHPSLPAKSVQELVALARRTPGALNYGSSGTGGFGHISGELFAYMAIIKMTVVPYKGASQALVDLIAGDIQVLFNNTTATIPHLGGGKVRALATTGAARLAMLPDLPTIAEAGVPGYDNTTWSAIAAPARTPRAIIARLNRDVAGAMLDLNDWYASTGSTMTGGTPEQFHDYLKLELTKMENLVRATGIKGE